MFLVGSMCLHVVHVVNVWYVSEDVESICIWFCFFFSWIVVVD